MSIRKSTLGVFVWAATVENQLWRISSVESAVEKQQWKWRFGVWQISF
jgi:hypothetical protein